MATFKPIAINRAGVNLPYTEGQYIVATKSFTDGVLTYQPGVYVDMLGGRQQLTMTGPKGDTGATGKTGETGAPGAAATITIGQVTNGSPGSPAQVSNSGTAQNAIINFVIPTGAQGPLGQQGAGLFHTLAASSASIVLNSILPQDIKPMVGDGVLFSNGDVRQVLSVNTTTVTLGEVLFSVKGDPGIGDATLSNIDGDSTVAGFTQAAVKGIAQAKNYYNLDAYDTFVSNGNGTGNAEEGTITVILDGSEVWDINAGIPRSRAIDGFAADGQEGLPNTSPYVAFSGGGTYKLGFRTQVDEFTVDTWKEYLRANPIVLKCKASGIYQYTEKVIENNPIRVANQDECFYWHEEWRKGLNLFSGETVLDTNTTFNNGIVNQISPDTNISPNYKIQAYTKSGDFVRDIREQLPAIIGTVGATFIKTSDFDIVRFGLNGTERDTLIGIDVSSLENGQSYSLFWYFSNITQGSVSWKDIMLVKGSHPYPYKPYNGGIVHEKDLSGIQLFAEGINPAQTIGGDWEDLGTVTTSNSTVLHAYRRL